jgi:Uncharacterized conserved protein (DUF2190)
MTPSLIKGFPVLAPILGRRFVKFTGTGKQIALAVAGDAIIGVTDSMGALNANDMCDVHQAGLYEVEAGAAFAAGDMLTADSTGRAVKAVSSLSTPITVGARANSAATAAGDYVNAIISIYRTPLGV